jgi:hypothetical protein
LFSTSGCRRQQATRSLQIKAKSLVVAITPCWMIIFKLWRVHHISGLSARSVLSRERKEKRRRVAVGSGQDPASSRCQTVSRKSEEKASRASKRSGEAVCRSLKNNLVKSPDTETDSRAINLIQIRFGTLERCTRQVSMKKDSSCIKNSIT